MSDENLPTAPRPAEVSPAEAMQQFIAEAVENPNIDATKLRELLQMAREVRADAAEAQFNQAYIAMRDNMPRVKKSGIIEYPKNKNDPEGPKQKVANFAKWEDLDEVIRPILRQHGFATSYDTAPRQGDGGGLVVTCILMHTGGHKTRTSIPVPLDTSGGKNNIQGYGSSLSYGKRYATVAALNIIFEGEDDDGVRGGMVFMSEDQVTELIDLLAVEKGVLSDLLLHYWPDGAYRSLEEVPVQHFGMLKQVIEKRNRGVAAARAKGGN